MTLLSILSHTYPLKRKALRGTSESQNMPRHSFTAPLYQRQEGLPAARPLQPMPPRAGKGQEQEAGEGRASVRKIWGCQNASLIKSSLKESFKQNQAKGLAACPFLLRVQMVPGHPVRDGPAQAGGWTR